MSYATGTTHYNLPQTVGSDKRDWTDTNQAFSDIDAAIYGAAQGASAATSAIETINGQIETITAAQAVDEGNISTLSGKVSTLESTVGTQAAAIADVRQDLQDNIESNHEASATSTHAYEIGDTFYYNDVLYKATAQIAIGGTIVPSTNCTAVTVMSEIDQLNSDLTELFAHFDTTPKRTDITPTNTSGTIATITADSWVTITIVGINSSSSGSAIGRILIDDNIISSLRDPYSLNTADIVLPLKAGTVVAYNQDNGNSYRYIVVEYPMR